MKKILLSIPGNSTFYKPSFLTFKKFGWQVRNIDYRKTDFIAAAKNYPKLPISILRELTGQKRPSVKRAINNNEIIRVAKQWRPDVFLTFKGETILPETMRKIEKLGTKTVNWYPDHLKDSKANNRFINSFNCFIYWDKWRTSLYHKKGLANVFYLPFCAIPEKRTAPKIKKYPINFVATWQPHREKRVSPVADLGLMIWGSSSWTRSGLSKKYYGGPLKVDEMIKIFRLSKITLNVHSIEKVYSEGTNVRTFEAPGAGSFLLANKRKSLSELFKVGKEIEVFSNNEELVEKTKFYLKNETIREKIARAGWARVKREHTYVNRFKSLLKHINET